DPSAEIALVAVTLGATLVYRDGKVSAEMAASELFVGPMMTALPATACLTAVRFPVWRDARIGVGFHEVSVRRSDFALAAAAAEGGVVGRVAWGGGRARVRPRRPARGGGGLGGRRAGGPQGRGVVRAALADIEPLSDLHASAEYRRRAAISLAVRAIADAYRAA